MANHRIPLRIVLPETSKWCSRLTVVVFSRREGALVNFLVGGLFLLVVGIIPVVGGWVSLVAGVLGLGTILLQSQALRERQPV